MDAFFNQLEQLTRLLPASRDALTAVSRRLELPKGYQLVKEDSVCNYLYFIERGLTRTYYFKDGKDVTDWISPENTFACSILSFICRKPDRRNIELLEPSVLYALAYSDIEDLCSQYHDIERLFRLLIASGLVELQKKFDDLHFSTASLRYQQLMQNHPDYLLRVPLGMIASYLGITQETLSRIRAQATF